MRAVAAFGRPRRILAEERESCIHWTDAMEADIACEATSSPLGCNANPALVSLQQELRGRQVTHL
jgi:hypothetical protein